MMIVVRTRPATSSVRRVNQCVSQARVLRTPRVLVSIISQSARATKDSEETDSCHASYVRLKYFCKNTNNIDHFIATAPIELECRVDDDCGPRLACINNECQDPCQATRPCHQSQTCRVENSSPIRTVLCTCPDDTFIGPNGECKPKGKQSSMIMIDQSTLFSVTPTPSCITDRDCSDPDKCVEGTCRDACSVDPCGANAICKSRLHASSCSCPIGYTGNPRVQCVKSK